MEDMGLGIDCGLLMMGNKEDVELFFMMEEVIYKKKCSITLKLNKIGMNNGR